MIRMLGTAAVLAVLGGCGTEIQVQVVDASTRNPVPQARVMALPYMRVFPRLSFAGPSEGRTDGLGLVTIEPELGDTVRLLVYADGFKQVDWLGESWGTFRERARSPRTDGPPRLVLYVEPGKEHHELDRPRVPIEVRVVDRTTGRGVLGARVDARSEPRSAFTDEDGRVEVRIRRGAEPQLVIQADGYRQVARPIPDWLQFTYGLNPEVEGISGSWIEEVEPVDASGGAGDAPK